MEYKGKLYGKIGRRYIPLLLTSEDVIEKPTHEELETIELALSGMIEEYELLDRGANQRLTNNINEAKLILEKVRKM